MRFDVHVHLHDDRSAAIEGKLDEAIGLIRNLMKSENKMNDKLTAALAKAQGAIADIQGKDASIKAYIVGEPERTKAALEAFAAEHGIDEDAAADSISNFVDQVTAGVNDTFSAINSNPAAGDTPLTPPEPTPADTNAGGAGNDSLGGGADSQDGGAGQDSAGGGAGSDVIATEAPVAVASSDPSVVSQTVTDDSSHTAVIVTDHPENGTTLVTPVLSGNPDAGSISVDTETGAPVADPASGVTLGETIVANDETPTAAALAEANPSAVVSAPADQS